MLPAVQHLCLPDGNGITLQKFQAQKMLKKIAAVIKIQSIMSLQPEFHLLQVLVSDYT
jgi:hypothetical protein